MGDTKTETKIVHGLRHRPTGALVRVREEVTLLQDEPYRNEETTWHMTLDAGHPVFDAGSPGMLARALVPTYGASERSPAHDGLDPAEIEPVIVEEVLTTTVRPAGVTMDVAVRIDPTTVVSIRPGLARSIPDLVPILEAVAAHANDLKAVVSPDGEYQWGAFSLTGAFVEAIPGGDPTDLVGRIVVPGPHAAPARRALGVVRVPFEHLAMARGSAGGIPPEAYLVACLSDPRDLPPALAEALREPMAPETAPTP